MREIDKIPKRLATTSHITPAGRKEITNALNGLVADAFALYTKSKNFHWHLSGTHFRDYHLLFDEQATKIFDTIDTLAERVRKIGGLTIHSIGEISKLQSIKDDNDIYVSPEDMVLRLLNDNILMAQKLEKAMKICDKYGDAATSNILQTIIDDTERRIWFLYELSQ